MPDYPNTIPYAFTARDYQLPFLKALQDAFAGKNKYKRFYLVWHRRSGKDRVNIADAAPRRLIQSPCLVKYIYPTLKMARENLWDGIGGDGFGYINHIPTFIRKSDPNSSDMKIAIRGGSLFQLGGTDNPDSLRGGNPKLVIFSEWAEQDPYAWDVVEPILRENNGIAIFNTTPKGDNHARALYDYAKDNLEWFTQTLTAEDTGIWTPEQLESIRMDIIKRFRASGRADSEAAAYFEQEYMCSFTSPVIGAYYGEGMTKAEKEGRITSVPVYDGIPVDTWWDLGYDDSMTIWFTQYVGQEIHVVDYLENSGEGIPYYAKRLQEKDYLYGKHYAPHDISVHELGTGKSRLEAAAAAGIKFQIGAKLDVDEGIDAVRAMLSRCWFDKVKCERGINCLKNYTKKWDEKNKVFKSEPNHNWASHGADAFRTGAVNSKPTTKIVVPTNYGTVRPMMQGMLA